VIVNVRYASVVIDVDSTLCGVEGIDLLAELRGARVAAKISELTARAMRGEIALEDVYGERLDAVRPSSSDIEILAKAYREALAPGAKKAITRLRDAGVALHLVSGGLRDAILPVARYLGFRMTEVHAVEIQYDAHGGYAGFTPSPLTTQRGKLDVVQGLDLPRPSLAVGDGATDLEMRNAVDAFAAFTGFVTRETVVSQAALEIKSFDDLTNAVLSGAP
jgi:phosphoserine phosphatase